MKNNCVLNMTPRKIFSRILRVVAEVYEVDQKEILADSRTQPLPEARRMIFLISVDLIGYTWTARYSRKSKSYLCNGRQQMASEIGIYAEKKTKYNQIKSEIDEY